MKKFLQILQRNWEIVAFLGLIITIVSSFLYIARPCIFCDGIPLGHYIITEYLEIFRSL